MIGRLPAPPGQAGWVTSTTGEFTFTHPGGPDDATTGSQPYIDFYFSAWVEGVKLVGPVSATYDDLVASFVVNDSQWKIDPLIYLVTVKLGDATPAPD